MTNRLLIHQVELRKTQEIGDLVEAREERAIIQGHQIDGAIDILKKVYPVVLGLHKKADTDFEDGEFTCPEDKDPAAWAYIHAKSYVTKTLTIIQKMIDGASTQKGAVAGKIAALHDVVAHLKKIEGAELSKIEKTRQKMAEEYLVKDPQPEESSEDAEPNTAEESRPD